MSPSIALRQTAPLDDYLAASELVDWQHPALLATAEELAAGTAEPLVIARRTFEFVRDEIRHSHDFQLNQVTRAASEVLLHRTGTCYAKSHLLAALLRANRIPAGFCYQRLSVADSGPPFCLHGLNAVFLKEHGWYRIDARGNKPGVEAQFSPPTERLAFPALNPGEEDLPEIHPAPLPEVIRVLKECSSVEEVYRNLPGLGQ